jgi:enoyl-CoA hydratase/carnithine racemase
MGAVLKSTSEAGTLILTLSNPEHRNALDPGIYAAGVEALNAAESNPDVHSVILTGEGRTFCAGGQLQRLLQVHRDGQFDGQRQAVDSLHSWIDSIRTFPKPVIAAVEGAAAGAGFSLALACDFVVASESAFFTMAYTRVGLSPDGGASWHLARALPRALASEVLMQGSRLTGQQLARLGLVNQVTPEGGALGAALQLAASLRGRAGNVLASVKELLQEAQLNALPEHLVREREHFMRNLAHPNAGEGIAAFLEKRDPRFK